VEPSDLPGAVSEVVGDRRSRQLGAFIDAMSTTIRSSGAVGMGPVEAAALQAFRDFNYDRIYLRPEAREQAERVTVLLRQLTDFFIDNPAAIGDGAHRTPGSAEAVAAAVRYVSGMTDRFALDLAVERLGWERSQLPKGV
jgi:dGTPase